MAAKFKTLTVEYYQYSIVGGNCNNWFDKIVELICNKTTSQNKGANTVGVREVDCGHRNKITGAFAKYRIDNLPKIGDIKSNHEKDIALARNEALLEKNYFVIHRNKRILAYHKNGNGSVAEYFAEHLTYLLNENGDAGYIEFSSVLDQDEIENILSRGVGKKISFSIAMPNAKTIDTIADDVNGAVAKLLSISGGVNIQFSISPDRGESLHQKGLLDFIKSFFKGDGNIKSARAVMLDSDGHHRHPINLITKTVTDVISVKMEGRYPNTEDMLQKLNGACDARKELFEGILAD